MKELVPVKVKPNKVKQAEAPRPAEDIPQEWRPEPIPKRWTV